MAFGQIIATAPVAGTSYGTFTTAKSMLTSSTATEAAAAAISIPSGFWQRGGALEIVIQASIGWASGNTMTFQVMMGSIVAFTSGAVKVTTTGGTGINAHLRFDLTCRSMGNGTLATLIGMMHGSGRMLVPPNATAGADYSAGSGIVTCPDTTNAVGTGFDSTIANTLDFFVGMGASSASNTFQVQQYQARAWGWLGS